MMLNIDGPAKRVWAGLGINGHLVETMFVWNRFFTCAFSLSAAVCYFILACLGHAQIYINLYKSIIYVIHYVVIYK